MYHEMQRNNSFVAPTLNAAERWRFDTQRRACSGGEPETAHRRFMLLHRQRKYIHTHRRLMLLFSAITSRHRNALVMPIH